MSALSKELEDSLKNLNEFKPEQLDALIREAISTFHMLQDKAQSKDPKDVEKALETALDLKSSLENQLSTLLGSLGIDMNELKTFMQDPSNFTPEEQTMMKEIDEQFKKLVPEQPAPKEAPKKKNKAKAWIAG